jgi:hypothetical protein
MKREGEGEISCGVLFGPFCCGIMNAYYGVGFQCLVLIL